MCSILVRREGLKQNDDVLIFFILSGYHGTIDLRQIGYTKTKFLYYGIMPDAGTGNCLYGCGSSSTFGNICSVSSHELIEAVTDPGVGLATSYGYPLAWYEATYGEIGGNVSIYRLVIVVVLICLYLKKIFVMLCNQL